MKYGYMSGSQQTSMYRESKLKWTDSFPSHWTVASLLLEKRQTVCKKKKEREMVLLFVRTYKHTYVQTVETRQLLLAAAGLYIFFA